MGAVLQGFGVVGSRPPYLWNILKGGRLGDPLFWIGDLGDNPQDRSGCWWIPPQCGPPFGSNIAKERQYYAVLVPSFGGINVGSGPI